MSKRRACSSSTPRILKTQKGQFQQTLPTRYTSKYLNKSNISTLRSKSIKTEVILNDEKLKQVFNKQIICLNCCRNIFKFRDMVNPNDQSVLPFLSSLRSSDCEREKAHSGMLRTKLQPFSVADKLTCNQKVLKQLADIKGRTKRLSNAFYRWHNKSGSGIKQGCFFQSKLRQTSQKFYHNQTFKNLFNPLPKPKPNQRVYTQTELICDRQRKIFKTIPAHHKKNYF